MPPLSSERPREVIRKLSRLGFVGPFGGGKHVFMRHPEKLVKSPVPVYRGRHISIGTLRAIIREAGSTPEEWAEL